jgi:hypothetical protein
MIKIHSMLLLCLFLTCCSPGKEHSSITFFEVPLVCGAAPEIGCGSRIKPLFLELGKRKSVAEVYTNRAGTIVAVKWTKKEGSDEIMDLFTRYNIDADPVTDRAKRDSLLGSMTSDTGWLKGMAVDSLSLYEAGVIANTLTDFALEAGLVNEAENKMIRRDIEAYFKKELVLVRTPEELNSKECQDSWRRNAFMVYQNHIGKQRAEAVSDYFDEHEIQIMKQESCCSEQEELTSTITCPYCKHSFEESMPTDICLGKYTCGKCNRTLTTRPGDCCVFCSYGDHKCPSMQ